MKKSEILKQARKLVVEQDKWVKGDWAVDEDGESTATLTKTACKFCAEGAIITVLMENAEEVEPADLYRTREFMVDTINGSPNNHYGSYQSIALWNDDRSRTHEEVVAMFDEAIQKAEELEGLSEE